MYRQVGKWIVETTDFSTASEVEYRSLIIVSASYVIGRYFKVVRVCIWNRQLEVSYNYV